MSNHAANDAEGGAAQNNRAEILKQAILRQYKSVRQFAIEMGIPYSTLVTALDRGIEGMAYGTVIKMCDKLSLNPVDFTNLEQGQGLGEQIVENRVMQVYYKLNRNGRRKAMDYMGDLLLIDRYQNTDEE
ncbi:MAG: transcriptional regulator [Lachnospiraceae bacterium]|nr:transcriptional regulator [Lachnospiraceae bacterium]